MMSWSQLWIFGIMKDITSPIPYKAPGKTKDPTTMGVRLENYV